MTDFQSVPQRLNNEVSEPPADHYIRSGLKTINTTFVIFVLTKHVKKEGGSESTIVGEWEGDGVGVKVMGAGRVTVVKLRE